MSSILKGLQLNELSTNKLAQYKTAAAADAKKADTEGDYKRGDKRFSGIVKATKKQFANDEKKEVAEAGNNYHANRTGFSRPSNHRDDERHDLDTPTQVWGLKINGKVWSKGGKDVTFTSKEAALNIRNSILKNRPDLEIGLVTKGGVSEELDENLHKWFKEKWVRFGPDGKIRGDCARGDDSEGKPKCLPQSKAHSLGKKGRASAASRKRREDPNPERSGKAINVNTKKKTNEEQLDELSCWSGYHRVAGTKAGFPGSCAKNKTNESEHSETCPHCGGEMVSEELMNEKKDACYYKVKSRYKVWPSAYASGALVKCRKKGADSWGNGGKKNEGVAEGLNEMDKSAPQPGRDGKVSHSTYGSRDKKGSDYFKGKEAPGKPITKKQMEKDTLDILKKQGVAEDQLDEKWTKKYKDSINCSNPKGFSQKAHCAGKQKNESAIMKGLKL